MSKYLILLLLVSCSYTQPDQERITYYRCEKRENLVTNLSEDYDNLTIKMNHRTVVLHRFVSATEEGYRNDSYLWQTKGTKGVLSELSSNGFYIPILKKCTIDL
jgi:membrane-bound inhibitor of C-type lysozyme